MQEQTLLHISEGFLPWTHAAAWTAVSAPFLVHSVRRVSDRMSEGQNSRLRVAAAAGFLFALSALKLPSVAGSCSHAVGVALGAILLGPTVMPALSFVVLTFQALVLAHGGVTTLGANLFSLGVAGPWVAWWMAGGHTPTKGRAFLGGFTGSVAVYLTTSAELAMAFPDMEKGVAGAFVRFSGLFAVTQLPIGVVEGIVTFVVLGSVQSYMGMGRGLAPVRGEVG